MTKKASFPLNAWYATAWDTEVKRALLARTICNKKLVIYRTESGDPAVLDDACWHRLAPLSLGKLTGDNVQCPYHGLQFEPGGRCVHMPSQDTLNPAASVRSYPAVERHRLIWVWPGDPALADPDEIPDMHWMDHEDWAGEGDTLKLNCNYQLVLDNLMDLTHETFIHTSSIGNAAVAEAPFEVSHTEKTAMVTRLMENIDPPPFWAKQLGKPGKVDRWQIIRFQAPCTINIDVGVAPTGTGAFEGDRSQGVNNIVCNTITPETETSSHYFWMFPRNYRIREQRITTEQKLGITGIFNEDRAVLEAQQIAMEENPDKEFYNLNIDAGAIWARRATELMIEREQPKPFRSSGVAAE